jgi:hypothetical protein
MLIIISGEIITEKVGTFVAMMLDPIGLAVEPVVDAGCTRSAFD